MIFLMQELWVVRNRQANALGSFLSNLVGYLDHLHFDGVNLLQELVESLFVL